MNETSIFDQPNQPFTLQRPLQNATAVLVLGILSIVICFVGVILGIIALILANKDMKMYRASPEVYTQGSYNNLKAGKTCAIVGLVLNVVGGVSYLIIIIYIIAGAGNTWN